MFEGRNTKVTFGNASDYAGLLENYLLTEGEYIYDAIRKGMSAVVPLNLVALLTWEELEKKICREDELGAGEIKSITAPPVGFENSPEVVDEYLWTALQQMTSKEIL
jgi:E3 ubiquitin-protein ligase HECTD3